MTALQVNGLPVNTRSDYAVQSIDRSVTLLCPFVPGRLQSCYYGEWRRRSTTIFSVEKPDTDCNSLTREPDFDEKYHVDRATFSLTISMLEAADSGVYECHLMILDPASPTAETVNFPVHPLNLTVDGKCTPLNVCPSANSDGMVLCHTFLKQGIDD